MSRTDGQPPTGEPVQAFIDTLRSLDRQATQLEKWPRERLLSELPEAQALLRHIGRLTRRFEQIRQTLQDEGVDRLAAEAQQRGGEHLAAMAADGALLESAVFAQRVGWTRQALSKALATQRVFYVDVQGARHFPAFFADPQYQRRHLEAVSKVLGGLPGAAKLQFMSTPKASLAGRTPLQALADGQFDAVKTAAEGFAQR